MKHMIKAGAAAVHFEDQLSSAKKCGHMGGKVLVTTTEAVNKWIAARLAADICGVATIIIARTDANGANLITTDYDDNDKEFLTGERSKEGFFYVRQGIKQAISRGLAYAPYSDVIWWKPRNQILRKHANLQKPFMQNTQANCCAITARPRLTGKQL